MASCLSLFLFFFYLGGSYCTSLHCLSFSTMSLESSISPQQMLSCPQQPEAPPVMDFHMVSLGVMYQDQPHGLQWHHGPWGSSRSLMAAWTPTWSLLSAQTTDISTATGTKDTNMAFGSSTDHWYFRWQQRPYTSTWLPVATGVPDTYLHDPWQQDGSGILTWPQDRECGCSKDHRTSYSLRSDHGHQRGLK